MVYRTGLFPTFYDPIIKSLKCRFDRIKECKDLILTSFFSFFLLLDPASVSEVHYDKATGVLAICRFVESTST